MTSLPFLPPRHHIVCPPGLVMDGCPLSSWSRTNEGARSCKQSLIYCVCYFIASSTHHFRPKPALCDTLLYSCALLRQLLFVLPVCVACLAVVISCCVEQLRSVAFERMDVVCFSRHSLHTVCLLYTSPSPRDKRQSRMPSSA